MPTRKWIYNAWCLLFLPICIWGYKIFEPKKERTACALVCVCMPVEQQKGKQLTHFVAAVAASSFLYANCLPPTHGHPYIRTHYKGNTHVQANKLKAFNVFLLKARLRFWFRLQIRCSLFLRSLTLSLSVHWEKCQSCLLVLKKHVSSE